MALPEPISGIVVLAAGWLLGKLDRWASTRSNADTQQAQALALLTQSLAHLDKTIGRLDGAIDRLWKRTNEMEHRISTLEGQMKP
jgi:septal ring factor EnvC (AmiA/AmiB activator)